MNSRIESYWVAAKKRQWCIYDLKYVLLGALLLFDIAIIPSPPLLVRFAAAALLITACFLPYLRCFFVPALPIIAWLVTFYGCQFIPYTWRPNHIFVHLLPTLEHILYGASLSESISRRTHPILDIMAWLPYGITHFGLPFVFSLALFVFGPPGSLPVFGQAFGYLNLSGVFTQLLFPNVSPWYEMSHGSAPADYSMHGEAGGLSRIDKILGLELYGSTFGTSPLVFGAFPSLHSANATIEMLFVVYLFPRAWPIAIVYTLWMWWSTMYLTHHYLVDLVGGSIYAFLTFLVAHSSLPPRDPTAKTRLDYLGGSMTFSIRALVYSLEDQCVQVAPLPNHNDEEASLYVPATRYPSFGFHHQLRSRRRRSVERDYAGADDDYDQDDEDTTDTISSGSGSWSVATESSESPIDAPNLDTFTWIPPPTLQPNAKPSFGMHANPLSTLVTQPPP